MRFETKAIRIGEEPDIENGSGDVVSPIHLSTTFARKRVDMLPGGYEYSRTANPTRDALERKLAALEDARFGLAFSSGMATETTALLALLRSGDHVIAFDDLYGGTKRLFRTFGRNFGVDFTYVDARDPDEVASAVKDNTRMIWLETPTNPLMKMCDIEEISEIAHDKGIIVAVDNTFATPYFQNPLKLGADIVVHSTTKYINGHSDSVGGAIMLSDEEMHERLRFHQNSSGAILSPFDSYMTLRGIKTLAVRMREHERNAMRIAEYLESHPKVRRVYYPGLESHPQHGLAKKQMSGYGGMISFEIYDTVKDATKFAESLRLFSLAESLGGVESLIEIPALMTHSSVPEEERRHIGISDTLIRMSVGIENVEDLIEDIEGAMEAL